MGFFRTHSVLSVTRNHRTPIIETLAKGPDSFSIKYCPPDRYWHSVSPPGPPAGKIPRSGERRAHELPEAKRRAEFMSAPNGVTQEF